MGWGSLTSLVNPVQSVLSGIGGGSNPAGSIFGIGQSGPQQSATNTLNAGATNAANAVQAGTQAAQQQLNTGQTAATNAANTGFQQALGGLASGYNTAGQQLATGGAGAVNTANQGFGAAQQAVNQAPNMVQSRQDLYTRLLGQGGLPSDVMNQLEAKTREEYGTGLRGAEQATSQFLGDSEARGLAGEEVARAAAQLGGTRANAIRDIETQNAQLARQEQTGAITTAMSDAYQQAGLDAQQAEYVSGLQEKLAEGGANLTAQEAQAAATFAAQRGTTLAGLIQQFAQTGAALSAEEAQALANITVGTATNVATVQQQPHGLLGLLGMNM